jgi:fructose/tagatose bisphosphate aldolase
MVDMSHYDEAENLEKTRVLTKECHARGIAVEAESGRIEGGEEGIADTGDLEGTTHTIPHSLYTTIHLHLSPFAIAGSFDFKV